jgi:hypothetical protein
MRQNLRFGQIVLQERVHPPIGQNLSRPHSLAEMLKKDIHTPGWNKK